jgi:hypothetical protein
MLRNNVQSEIMDTRIHAGPASRLHITEFSTLQNNPQHLRVLANELLATRLAERVGLPVPITEIIDVKSWLIDNTSELRMDMAGMSSNCKPGLQFGARYVCDPAEGQIFDYLPESMLPKVKNLTAFAGMLVVDKWLGNANGRQAVFWKKASERKYIATFIDQGYCFNAGEWNFPDSALRGVYARNLVYQHITGWQSFEPWLSRIENLAPAAIHEIAENIPPEWTGDQDELEQLVENIVARQSKVRDLITAFRNSARQPFPAWSAADAQQVPAKKSGVQ